MNDAVRLRAGPNTPAQGSPHKLTPANTPQAKLPAGGAVLCIEHLVAHVRRMHVCRFMSTALCKTLHAVRMATSLEQRTHLGGHVEHGRRQLRARVHARPAPLAGVVEGHLCPTHRRALLSVQRVMRMARCALARVSTSNASCLAVSFRPHAGPDGVFTPPLRRGLSACTVGLLAQRCVQCGRVSWRGCGARRGWFCQCAARAHPRGCTAMPRPQTVKLISKEGFEFTVRASPFDIRHRRGSL